MAITTVALSGDQNINALLMSHKWADSVIVYGYPVQASEYGNYSRQVDHDNNNSTPAITVNEASTFMSLNQAQRDVVDRVFADVRDFTNLSLLRSEPASSAEIRIGMTSSPSPGSDGAYAHPLVRDDAWGGDVWLNTADYNTPRVGARSYHTFYHEIGHALGLKHGHEVKYGNNNTMTADRNSLEFSTMTYADYIGQPISDGKTFSEGHAPQSFMMYDIAALQYLYGADFASNADNTNYRFDPNTGETFVGSWGKGVPQDTSGNNVNVIFRTIWDGNGIDTYDFSAYDASRQMVIDLAPGGWTDVDSDSTFQAARLGTDAAGNAQWARGQVFNSLLYYGDTRSLIENAIGGAGDDTIRGNQTNNNLQGRDGNDTLHGFDGADVLDQGLGGGALYGGNGSDALIAGNGGEVIDGGEGWDRVDYSRSNAGVTVDTSIGKVFGGWAQGDTLVSIEEVVGSAHIDHIVMGNEDNRIYGGWGDDQIDARGGSNSLYGEGGNDTLRGGAGRQVGDLYHAGDWFDGGANWDTVAFSKSATVNLATGAHGGEALDDTFISIEQFNGSVESDTFVASNNQRGYFAGGDGVDYFYGGSQEDWFQGGKGADYVNGGDAHDMVSYADAPNAITVQMSFNDGNTDGKIIAGEWGLDTLVSVEDVEGTAFADYMIGDERGNKFLGLGGNDRLQGDEDTGPHGSPDILMGGTGDDTIAIGAADAAFGGADHDTATFVGGPINLNFSTNTHSINGQGIVIGEFETYVGSGAGDTVVGAAHGENINLGNGNDFAYGMNGNDFIWASEGADTMDGGAGYDTIVFHKAMVADWQAGMLDVDIASDPWASWEAIQGSAGADRIRTNSWGFSVELRGGGGNDVLATGVTGIVSDTLRGEAGDDVLNGGAGIDTMEGGANNDTYMVDNALDKVVEGASEGTDNVNTSVSYQLAAGAAVETLRTMGANTTGAIHLTGNAFANRILGNAAGNTLNGGLGADTLEGYAGSDTYLIDNAGDAIVEAAGYGTDTAVASASYSLAAGASVEVLRTAAPASTAVISLTGNEFVNTLQGNAGANALNGRGGADVMQGFAGNDIYYVDNALDKVIEGASQGTDTIMTTVSYTIASGVVAETLRAADHTATSAINLVGNAIANTLVGNAGNNILNGGAAGDTMHGLGGDDSYLVDSAGDKIVEAAGKGTDNVSVSASYQLGAGVSVETLRTINAAATTAINLNGNEFANAVTGNAGSNILNGRAGSDKMTGGGGNDYFVFNTALSAASNLDSILDFNVAQDTIQLENTIFTALGAGPFTAGMFNTGAAATQADDRIVYNSTTGALIYDSNGNAAGGAVQFASLSKGLALTHADFQII